MSKELSNQDFISKELAKLDPFETRIGDLKEKHKDLKVEGVDDKENYVLCKSAHLEFVTLRTDIEKAKKKLKAPVLELGRKIESRTKELIEDSKLMEDYLQEQRKIVEDEKARIVQAREDEIRAEQEQKRKEEEDRIEQVRLDQERVQKELDAKQAELKAKEDAIKADQEKIESDKKEIADEKQRVEDEKQESIKLTKEKKEADKQAKQDEEDRKAEEAKAEINRIADEKAEAKRLEALKPDLEKIKAFGELLLAIPMPKVKARKAKELIGIIQDELEEMGNNLIETKL